MNYKLALLIMQFITIALLVYAIYLLYENFTWLMFI